MTAKQVFSIAFILGTLSPNLMAIVAKTEVEPKTYTIYTNESEAYAAAVEIGRAEMTRGKAVKSFAAEPSPERNGFVPTVVLDE